jgi:hypothetical protein
MADAINVTIDAREAIATLAATRGVMEARRAVHDAAANAVAVQVRGWFIARNAAKSKHTSSQYWAQAAEAVSAEADAESGRVIVRHPGTAWHRYGGTIHAKPGKAMAIPLRDEVYGVWPSEQFPNRGDAFVWRRNGKAFLVARQDKGVRSGARTLRILYILLKSVSKGADTTVLPSEAEQIEAASAAVRQIIRLALRRRAAAQGAV